VSIVADLSLDIQTKGFGELLPEELLISDVVIRRLREKGPGICLLGCVEKTFPGKERRPQISPLRFAPVEMTKGRAALRLSVVVEQAPFHQLGWGEGP
jgi:hypothetical protein